MKLFYSKTSPYARKVWICAKLQGLDGEITLETVHPIKNSDVLEQTNPLGKVPALVTEQNQLIVDSPVICHTLDQAGISHSPDQPLTLGKVALGCALGYLDFRFQSLPWREEYNALANFYGLWRMKRPSGTLCR